MDKSHKCFMENVNEDDIIIPRCTFNPKYNSEGCGKVMSFPITARFIKHVSEENLSRLAVSLIQKGQLTKAESTLADHIMKEI